MILRSDREEVQPAELPVDLRLNPQVLESAFVAFCFGCVGWEERLSRGVGHVAVTLVSRSESSFTPLDRPGLVVGFLVPHDGVLGTFPLQEARGGVPCHTRLHQCASVYVRVPNIYDSPL